MSMHRRDFLKGGLAAGLAVASAPLVAPGALRLARSGSPQPAGERGLRGANLTTGDHMARETETDAVAARGDLREAAVQEIDRLEKPDKEWKKLLPRDRYQVLFDEDTEPAGSSPLDREKRSGTFVCAACFLPLFTSAMKFDSGTGWPSFTTHIPGRVETKRDFKLILPRTEYHCIRCRGHQGHVFKDGPPPTGQRWCNNGLALEFVPDGAALPALRT